MNYWKNGNNEIYDNLEFSTESQNRIVEEILKKGSNGTDNLSELDSKRIERMKKKEYGDLFKKVVVASFSLLATGGIIAGVIEYNSKNSNNNQAIKNVTESTQEVSTDNLLKETEVENQTEEKETVEEKEIIDDVVNDKTFYRLNFDEDVNGGIVKVKNFEFKREYDSANDEFSLVVRNVDEDGKYKVIDTRKGPSSVSSIYTQGDKVYFDDEKGIKAYDLITSELDYIFDYSTDGSKMLGTNHTVCGATDDYLYFSTYAYEPIPGVIDIKDWGGVQYFSYAYNIKTKKITELGNRLFVDCISGDYYVMAEIPDYNYDKPGYPYDSPMHVVKINGDKLKEVKSLGERTYCNFTGEGVSYSEGNPHKMFFIKFDKTLEYGYTNLSEATIYTYDIDSNEIEKYATLSASKMGLKGKKIIIEEINDDYCVLSESGSDKRQKYTFATNKLEDCK